MQFYTAHFILFILSALLSVRARRISGKYLRICLPGFFFGLIFGSIHLATVGRVLVFAILSGAAYFAAECLAVRTVRFKKLVPETRSFMLAGAIAGFAGSTSLAAALRFVGGNELGPWDYCRITFIGTFAGIIFLFIDTPHVWKLARFPEGVREALGYFIWQGSVGIAMVISLRSGPYKPSGLLPSFYFSEVVPLWHTTRLALGDKWYEFLFGTSALQNYLSELFGILIAVVVVDRVIKYRTERRERPRRDMASVLTFELMDTFIAKYLPTPYRCNGASGRRFGSYHASSGLYKFHKEVLSWSVVTTQIISTERLRWRRINWPNSSGLTEDQRSAEETRLKSVLSDIRKYGRDIGDFLLQHQAVLDEGVLFRLGELRFIITTGFAGYYEPLKITYHHAFGVDIETLLPKVLRQTIELNLYLERIYGQEHPGGIGD
jgi:hypothetical protein